MSTARPEFTLAALVAGAMTATTLLLAVVVWLAFAASTRDLLAFPFGGVEPSPRSALAIFATNARLLLMIVAATVVVQSPWCACTRAERAPIAVIAVAALDTLLGLQVALNVAVVGAALGAYGARMLAAILPHGPVELAAFAVALALYVDARRERVATQRVAATAIACLGLLALAAVLETYVAL